jgi:hypothetical protein
VTRDGAVERGRLALVFRGGGCLEGDVVEWEGLKRG